MENHSSLHDAIKSGDLLKVKKLLDSSSSASKGRALYSSIDGQSGILQYIIKQYRDTNEHKYIEMFSLILKHCNSGIINSQDSNKDFPLLVAAKAGYVFLNQFQKGSLIRRLKLSQEVDWNVVDVQGHNVLFNAILSNDPECCKIVLNQKETDRCIYSTANDGSNILHFLFRNYTAEPGQREVVNLIVNKLKSLYVDGNKKSAKITWFDRLLLQSNKLGETPLHVLVKSSLVNDLKDDIDFGKLLSKSDLLACTKNGDSVINLAVKHGNDAVIDALLGATPQEYSGGVRSRMNLINECRSDQLTECLQTLLERQEDISKLESEEYAASNEMYDQLSKACLKQLEDNKEREAELKDKIEEAEFRLHELIINAEEEGLSSVSSDDLEAEIEDYRAKIQDLTDKSNLIKIAQKNINLIVESHNILNIVRQNFNKIVSEVKAPLDRVMLASTEHWYRELIARSEDKRIFDETVLNSLDFVKEQINPQVIQEVKEKSAASQKIRQKCLNQISKMREILPNEVVTQSFDEKLENLEKDCKELIARDLLLSEKQTDLEFEEVLKGQLLLRNAILEKLDNLQSTLQTDKTSKEIRQLHEQLECVSEALGLTRSMLSMKSQIENIKKESAKLDEKEKIAYSKLSGVSLTRELRDLVADKIALVQLQTLLEESIIKDILKQKRITGHILLDYRVKVPAVEMLVNDLELGNIQSNRLHLLNKTRLKLQILDKMLSDESCVESKDSLSKQLEEQQDRLKQVERDRGILQQEIRGKQESGIAGELPSGLSSEIEQLKQSEENLGKRIDKIKAAIGALEAKIEESNIQKEIQELKYALFENLTDQNFHILLHCKEMFGSYSTNDPELVSRIIKGYKKFSNVEDCGKYYALCSQLGVDIGAVRHAVESRNVALLSAVVDEENPDVKGLGDGILRVRDSSFLLSVLTDVECAFDMILSYAKQEGLTFMYPELVIAMLVSRTGSVELHNVLANSGNLFDNVLEESSCEQLSELAKLIMQSASSTEQQQGNLVILKNKIVDFAFKCMNDGHVDKLKALIDGDPTLIYSEKNEKSLLEIASDLLMQDLVRHIISVHRKLIAQARQNYAQDPSMIDNIKMSFNNLSKVNSLYVIDILKENKDFFDAVDSATRDELISNIFNNAVECGNTELLEYCTQVYPALVERNRRVSYDPAQVYGARSRIRSTPADTTSGRGVDTSSVAPVEITVNDFGILSQYVAAVVSGDIERFKKEVLEPFNSNPSNYAKLSHRYVGHSIFTLVAAFGNPEQWNKLENGYNNIKNERKTKDAFSSIKSPLNGNRMATVCSPLQAAVIQNNMQMIHHFIKKIDPKELKETYGDSKRNVFHTCMLSQKPESAAYIMRNSRFPLDVLVSAFLQPDEKGVTPFAMAFQQGYKKICMDFIDRVEIAKTQVRNLITNEIFIKDIIDSKDDILLDRLFRLKYYATESNYDKYSINLKKHRIAGHSLFAYACKQNDENFVKNLVKYYTEKELLDELTGIIDGKLDVQAKVLETILSAIIAETTDPNLLNKIFNKVIGHPAAFEAFTNIDTESYSRVLEENFSIDKVIELNNPILLKGLIGSGREVFKLKSGKALSDLGLAVCFDSLLDVCCDYLKNNPEEILHGSVLPHGAILSNHVELLKQLIEKDSNLLMKQYDVKLSPYKEIAARLKKNYGCEFRSSETIYDFAVREGANVEVINCIKDAVLNHYSQLLSEAKLRKVDDNLFNVVLNNANEVRAKYPDLYGYVIEQFNVENFIRSAHPKKNNMFHLVNEENVGFLSEIVEKVYKHTLEIGDKKKLSALVNHIRESDGLSFFHYAALHGDYDLYRRIKPCGDIASKTAKGANVMHLCAQSAMKDDKGVFEVENLLKENKKLAEVSDKEGRSLLDYAASSRVSDFRAREEIFDLILSKKMDKSIAKLSQKNHEARVIGAIFASRNRQFTDVLLKRLISEKKVGNTTISKILLNVIKNTSDPAEKARLLDYQAELENYAETTLSFGESRAEGRESPSSAFVQTGQSEVPRSEAAEPLIQFPHDEESTALGSQATMTGVSTQASPSAAYQDDSEISRVRSMAGTSAQADQSAVHRRSGTALEPLIELPDEEENAALDFQTAMTGVPTQASPSAVHRSGVASDPTLPDDERIDVPSVSSQVVRPFSDGEDYSVYDKSGVVSGHERPVSSRDSRQLDAFGDPSDDLLPESEIIVSSSKKAILDSQNEIESLIQSGDTSRCIRAINSAPSASVFQLKTLSNDISIAGRAFLNGNIDLIEACMNSGKKLNPNITDNEKNTLLHQFVGYFERDPRMLLDAGMRNLFLRLCMDYGFDINHKNSNGNTVLDRLNDLVEGLSSSQVDLESSGIDEFMISLLAHSRMSDQAVKNIATAQNEFFARDSVYNISRLVDTSIVLQNKFSEVFYEVCGRILSEEAGKHKGVAEANYSRLNKILNDECLRKTLANTDADGNNVLQRLCQDIASGKINARDDRVLKLFETIISNLKDKDKALLEDLLFNNRNSRFENCIEAIPRIPGADALFKKLEELLLKKKIAESCDFNSMLVNCAESANDNLYNYLRTNYAVISINNVDINGNSSLCKAVVTGSQGIVKAVLSTGTNINRKDKNGNTPLHALLIFMMSNPELVKEQHISLVKFLASRGALLNVKNNMNISPIMLAESIDKKEELAKKFTNQKVSILESLIAGSEEHLGLKSKCISELKPYIELGKGMKYEDIHADVIGGVLSADMCNARLQIGKLLNGDFCKENELKTVKFNFSDTNKGYVQNVGKKRNYVVTEGLVKLKLYWTPVVPKGAKEQVVNVIIRSDGTISLSDKDIEKYGARGEGINFNRCITYVGGIKLEDALKNGRWRDKESPSKAQKRASSSQSRDDRPDHGRAEQVQRDAQIEKDIISVPRHHPSRLLDRDDIHGHGSSTVSKSESQFGKTEGDGNLSASQSTHTSPSDRVGQQASTDDAEATSAVMFGEQSTSSVGRLRESQEVKKLRLLLNSISELPQELKDQILSTRSTIDKLRNRINACIKSDDREGIAHAVESMASSYCELLGHCRLIFKKLYDENADKSLLELCIKEYQSDLNKLLEQGIDICASEVSSECKDLVCKVCEDEFEKYDSLSKVQRFRELSGEIADLDDKLTRRASFVETFGLFSSRLRHYREILGDGDLKFRERIVKKCQEDLKELLELSVDLHLLINLPALEDLRDHRNLVHRACNAEIEKYLTLFDDQQLRTLSQEVNNAHGELIQMFSKFSIFVDGVTGIEQSTSQVEHPRSDIAKRDTTTPKQRVVQGKDDIQSSDSDSDSDSKYGDDDSKKASVSAPAVDQVVPVADVQPEPQLGEGLETLESSIAEGPELPGDASTAKQSIPFAITPSSPETVDEKLESSGVSQDGITTPGQRVVQGKDDIQSSDSDSDSKYGDDDSKKASASAPAVDQVVPVADVQPEPQLGEGLETLESSITKGPELPGDASTAKQSIPFAITPSSPETVDEKLESSGVSQDGITTPGQRVVQGKDASDSDSKYGDDDSKKASASAPAVDQVVSVADVQPEPQLGEGLETLESSIAEGPELPGDASTAKQSIPFVITPSSSETVDEKSESSGVSQAGITTPGQRVVQGKDDIQSSDSDSDSKYGDDDSKKASASAPAVDQVVSVADVQPEPQLGEKLETLESSIAEGPELPGDASTAKQSIPFVITPSSPETVDEKLESSGVSQAGITTPGQRVVQSRDGIESSDSEYYSANEDGYSDNDEEKGASASAPAVDQVVPSDTRADGVSEPLASHVDQGSDVPGDASVDGVDLRLGRLSTEQSGLLPRHEQNVRAFILEQSLLDQLYMDYIDLHPDQKSCEAYNSALHGYNTRLELQKEYNRIFESHESASPNEINSFSQKYRAALRDVAQDIVNQGPMFYSSRNAMLLRARVDTLCDMCRSIRNLYMVELDAIDKEEKSLQSDMKSASSSDKKLIQEKIKLLNGDYKTVLRDYDSLLDDIKVVQSAIKNISDLTSDNKDLEELLTSQIQLLSKLHGASAGLRASRVNRRSGGFFRSLLSNLGELLGTNTETTSTSLSAGAVSLPAASTVQTVNVEDITRQSQDQETKSERGLDLLTSGVQRAESGEEELGVVQNITGAGVSGENVTSAEVSDQTSVGGNVVTENRSDMFDAAQQGIGSDASVEKVESSLEGFGETNVEHTTDQLQDQKTEIGFSLDSSLAGSSGASDVQHSRNEEKVVDHVHESVSPVLLDIIQGLRKTGLLENMIVQGKEGVLEGAQIDSRNKILFQGLVPATIKHSQSHEELSSQERTVEDKKRSLSVGDLPRSSGIHSNQLGDSIFRLSRAGWDTLRVSNETLGSLSLVDDASCVQKESGSRGSDIASSGNVNAGSSDINTGVVGYDKKVQKPSGLKSSKISKAQSEISIPDLSLVDKDKSKRSALKKAKSCEGVEIVASGMIANVSSSALDSITPLPSPGTGGTNKKQRRNSI
ncbi:hypothetical protein [Ehrlichia canis]|uniref:hypothetical protein n=1 Tax=Ehrlichia canis TaxID=944 RepID=UPI001F2F172C|nr:hypothetical protein [Ehrlichia canis]UKC52960.1 hypothetical protein s20019040002_000001 [Ehrlichia canis]UKC53897.1 hypothetical protein s20026770001_000001 [Ehrlichia canis]UKC54833.1 hypothetical protein s21009500007_000001 [Ehrlichia canis]